jgi:hypothetical protein
MWRREAATTAGEAALRLRLVRWRIVFAKYSSDQFRSIQILSMDLS